MSATLSLCCVRCWTDGLDDSDPWWAPMARPMIVCSDCGNKRCPRATNHRFDCTNSNEPGQRGSVYADWREVGGE